MNTSRSLVALMALLTGAASIAWLNAAPSPQEKEPGFTSLFNGKDFTGWVYGRRANGAENKSGKGYQIENGVLYSTKDDGGNLYTEKEYANFVFRFEFRLTPNANNGIGIRAPLEGDAAYVGMEIQVLDDGGSQYTNLLPGQYHGSIYKVAAARRGFQKPVGEWNSEERVDQPSGVPAVRRGARRTAKGESDERASTPSRSTTIKMGGEAVLQANEGELLVAGRRRAPMRIKVDSTTALGATMSMVVSEVSPGASIPIHLHRNEDELIFIHTGSGIVTLGDSQVPSSTGAVLYAPRRIWHGIENTGSTVLTWCAIWSPPGFEQYFRETGVAPEDSGAGPTPAQIAESARKYGMVSKNPA